MPIRSSHKVVVFCSSLALAFTAVLAALLVMTNAQPVQAVGLDVTITAGYNLVVDSNVSSPSTYAPSVATVMGEFCNTSGSTATDVVGYIGDYNGGASSTPGVYPVRDSDTDPTFDAATGDHPHLNNTGDYSFTHVGGRTGLNDAIRYMGDIPNGECRVQYWHFSYPQCENLGDGTPVPAPCGSQEPVWGETNVDSDDLWLEFDIWGESGDDVQTGNARWRMTMRNEISAMANKIQPNPNGQWFNTNTSTISPGDVITSNGILYELGNINKGFDNDGDFDPGL